MKFDNRWIRLALVLLAAWAISACSSSSNTDCACSGNAISVALTAASCEAFKDVQECSTGTWYATGGPSACQGGQPCCVATSCNSCTGCGSE